MSIYKKLFEAKKEIGKISKDSTNPFYKSKYFDINQLLEHVEPILHKHGLMILQPVFDDNIRTQIIEVETGEKIESMMSLIANVDPQKRGSEITYYRRYTLGSLLALQAEDDDANATTKTPSQPKEGEKEKDWLNKLDSEKNFTKQWLNIVEGINKGTVKSVSDVREYYKVSKVIEADLEVIFKTKNK